MMNCTSSNLKAALSTKDTVKKRPDILEKKAFTNHISDKELRIKNPQSKIITENPVNNVKDWEDASTRTTWKANARERICNKLDHCLLLFSRSVMSRSFVTAWTAAPRAPLPMRFLRREHWSGLAFLSPGDLLNLQVASASPTLAGGFLTTDPPRSPNSSLGKCSFVLHSY